MTGIIVVGGGAIGVLLALHLLKGGFRRLESRPGSLATHRPPRPADHLPNPPPHQIPIDGRPHRPAPAGSFLGGFRTPALSTGAWLRQAGIRNPSPKRS